MNNDCCKISPEDKALLQAGDYTPEELFGVGGKPSCPTCYHATGAVDAVKPSRPEQRLQVVSDLELEQRALEACGYRVHVKERNGTRWLMAVKGLGVRYEHWHPLTNINQAMQLLIDADFNVSIGTHWAYVETEEQFDRVYTCDEVVSDARALLDAQCRAIVTACASLKPVR